LLGEGAAANVPIAKKKNLAQRRLEIPSARQAPLVRFAELPDRFALPPLAGGPAGFLKTFHPKIRRDGGGLDDARQRVGPPEIIVADQGVQGQPDQLGQLFGFARRRGGCLAGIGFQDRDQVADFPRKNIAAADAVAVIKFSRAGRPAKWHSSSARGKSAPA